MDNFQEKVNREKRGSDFSTGRKSPLGGAHPQGLNAGPNFSQTTVRGKPPPLLTQGEQPCKRQKPMNALFDPAKDYAVRGSTDE
ncbi:MAG: hypothetical protein DA408_00390 [Bacteroidetes bacterium]|nr:MAG: hypothetical protein C7N36_17930 [Bacteroidota bacterium]PTM15112.1 MAG: hypothetical protein DA408_00390 [Bacteroidota bacterium]